MFPETYNGEKNVCENLNISKYIRIVLVQLEIVVYTLWELSIKNSGDIFQMKFHIRNPEWIRLGLG